MSIVPVGICFVYSDYPSARRGSLDSCLVRLIILRHGLCLTFHCMDFLVRVVNVAGGVGEDQGQGHGIQERLRKHSRHLIEAFESIYSCLGLGLRDRATRTGQMEMQGSST